LRLHDIKSPYGAKKRKTRKGRGIGSGCGKTSTRGHKGQKQRSGSGINPYFEGGQMPLIRRIPKRGFNNKRFTHKYQIVNIFSLNKFQDGSKINPEILKKEKLISNLKKPVKILGGGELNKKIDVMAHAFSEKAKSIIEETGGKAVIIGD
jgi:large subunit ribosomal protein L15